MGGEGVLLFIWMMSTLVVLVIVLKMAATQRETAYRVAIGTGAAAYVPIFLSLGPILFDVLRSEFIVASVVGGTALLHSRRFRVFIVFTIPILAFAADRLLRMPSVPETPAIVTFIGLLGEFRVILAPIFATLAAVFFVGAFIEKRRYGA
jgi:hypothetical protein